MSSFAGGIKGGCLGKKEASYVVVLSDPGRGNFFSPSCLLHAAYFSGHHFKQQ